MIEYDVRDDLARCPEYACGQVSFILAAVGANLRFASTEDVLTSAYDRPPQRSEALTALWVAAARPRALAAHERRCRNADSGAELLLVTNEANDAPRADDDAPGAALAVSRHRERNRAAAVKACSESMLGSLLWMSGHLRNRMAAVSSAAGRVDWMGQCNPTAPPDVWPGALPSRSRHARSRRRDTCCGRCAGPVDPRREGRRLGPSVVEAGAEGEAAVAGAAILRAGPHDRATRRGATVGVAI